MSMCVICKGEDAKFPRHCEICLYKAFQALLVDAVAVINAYGEVPTHVYEQFKRLQETLDCDEDDNLSVPPDLVARLADYWRT